ncbi:SpaH/EbpB family LPXTG-anchored major pilin [Eubacterium sp. An3]|uniref:SpaH/EbpB family LPXTG-anchored major pilin n=1 Tax=Eubacterium sp. An3 TaxID=1965628 RepID=UPI000B389F3B|nr:SpaH/EbpB family LPXTG-anchored major pilin [Eubacterium sp. An3]OUO29927.1 hypothetical protein B5F87_00340 [Eubacterium sp. An3]
MKKMMKKLIAMAAALVMIVTLLPAVGVNAATGTTFPSGNGKITIDSEGGKYSVYQIATVAQTSTNGVKLEYTPTTPFTQNDVNDILAAGAEEGGNPAALQELLNGYLTTKIPTAKKVADLNNVEYGLYMIVEDEAPQDYLKASPSVVMVPQFDNGVWNNEVTVTPKHAKNDFTKIVNDNVNDTVSAGDEITYTISGTMPWLKDAEAEADDAHITITDTLTGDLSFVEPNTIVEFKYDPAENGTTPNTAITEYTPTVSGNVLTIEIKDEATLKAIRGKKFTLTYKVKVADNITPGEVGKNKASLDSNGGGNPGDTPEIPVYSFAIKVTKKGEGTERLQGVKFELYRETGDGSSLSEDDTKLYDLITGTGGVVTTKGLEKGTYWLKEIETVNGYTLLANPIKIELIEGENGTLTFKVDNATDASLGTNNIAEVEITNNKGFSLPETGGMGTYLFTIGGIVIMAGAAFALIAMKKRA